MGFSQRRQRLSRQQGGCGHFAENLWAATEVLAKAELLTLPRRPILEGKNYGLIKSRLNPHGGE